MQFCARVLVGLALWAQGCGDPAQADRSERTGPAPGARALARPPAASGDPTTSSGSLTFALDTLQLGEAPRAGGDASADAWMEYGYDLDGKHSSDSADDVCTPRGALSVADGDAGVDNSFGANILGIIRNGGGGDPSEDTSASISSGDFTLQLQIDGLSAEQAATQTNQGLTSRLLPAGPIDESGGAEPTFTPADDWPVRPEWLLDPSDVSKGATVVFPGSYVVDGTFVTGSAGRVTVRIVLPGEVLDLQIQHAIITMELVSGEAAVHGAIAGVLDTEELVAAFRTMAGRISPSLCSSATFESVAQQIRGASDMLVDGTNRPGIPCSAISIGVGFTAKRVGNPTRVAAPSSPATDPCVP